MEKIKELLNKRIGLVSDAEAALTNGDVDKFNALEDDINKLDNEIEALKLANANLNAMKDNQTAKDLSAFNENPTNTQVVTPSTAQNVLSNEQVYENAWAKDLMGKELTNEEKLVFENVNKEFKNAYTHDTTNTAILIPTTVVAGIFKRAEEMYPLFGDVKKFNVRGKLAMKRHVSIDEGDASWYLESEVTADEKNTFDELELDGKELSKAVTISWKLRAMAITDFIPYIINELAERVGVALGVGVARGTGVKDAKGIETTLTDDLTKAQIQNYTVSTGMVYKDLTAAVAKLHSTYQTGSAFYANNSTIWNVLANVVDGNGRPIFIPDATAGGVGRLFGYPVKADAGVSEGNIIFGNPQKGYMFNTNEPFSITTEVHAKQRTVDYVAYSIVDGDVLDQSAFVLITPGI